jgi:hypothetical protein
MMPPNTSRRCGNPFCGPKHKYRLLDGILIAKPRWSDPRGSVVNDGLPAFAGPFSQGTVKLKPKLTINILIWDFAALYAAEREVSSVAKFADVADDRIRF